MNARAQDCNDNLNFSLEQNPNFGLMNFDRSNDFNAFRIQQNFPSYSHILPNVEICPCSPATNWGRDLQPYMVPNLQSFHHQRQFNQPLHFPQYHPYSQQQPDQPCFPMPQAHTGDQSRYWDDYWRSYWSNYFRQLREDPRYVPAREPERQPEPEPQPERNDADQPRRRRQPHVPGNDRPENQPRPQPNDRRQNPEGPTGRMQDIVRHARESVGQALFRFIPGTPGRLGCAASVSAALNKAGFNYARHAGVGGLTQILMRNGWTRHEGIQNARPGDVVVVARRAGWENGGGGSHIGIVGENGKVYHNSSGRQQWIEDSLQRVFGGGMMRFILRPPNR